jgi:peptide-methionine (S)-S-oxide reductase
MKRSALLALSAALGVGCASSAADAGPLPAPKADLPEQTGTQQAVFAAGCFWCVEAVFEELEGVTNVVSGYAGGSKANADYEKVAAGQTKHAEAVRVTYDPEKISYAKLLHVLFSTHDPTQKNRQGPDVGTQYRSAVFYETKAQKKVAKAYIAQLEGAGVFEAPIQTTLEPLDAFYPAEDYHQDFVKKHPNHGYVRAWALPKVEKLKKRFPDALK